jgi:hypothetical protein
MVYKNKHMEKPTLFYKTGPIPDLLFSSNPMFLVVVRVVYAIYALPFSENCLERDISFLEKAVRLKMKLT